MKNTFKLIGIIAFVTVIGFSFASCGENDGSTISGGGNVSNEKAVYTSIDSEGNVYELTITKNSDKAAYEPKAGDLFKLVITFVNGTMKTSEGTVAQEVSSGSTITVTLSVSNTSFTVSINTTTAETPVMTEIMGTIPITSSTDNNTSPVNVDDLPLTPQMGNGGGNKDIAVTGVSLNKTTLSLEVGDTETLTAFVIPANATNKTVTWSSSDSAVASVLNSGEVTAVSTGSATITVTTVDGEKTATCNVTVSAPLTSATLESYLATLPGNTINTAYNILLKVSNIGEFPTIKAALLKSGPFTIKYVNLDLTGNIITEIPDDAFRYCPSLASINIPNSITRIGMYAFAVCENISSVTIPESVTSIEQSAFTYCTSLQSVTIPDIRDFADFTELQS